MNNEVQRQVASPSILHSQERMLVLAAKAGDSPASARKPGGKVPVPPGPKALANAALIKSAPVVADRDENLGSGMTGHDTNMSRRALAGGDSRGRKQIGEVLGELTALLAKVR